MDVEPWGSLAHGHEVEDSVDIFFMFDEFVKGDVRIESSFGEFVDGDLREDLFYKEFAFVVFEGVDDVVDQVFEGFGVEDDVSIFVFGPDFSAWDCEDGVDACGFDRFSDTSLLVVEFGEESAAADFFSVWGASGDLRDQHRATDEHGCEDRW